MYMLCYACNKRKWFDDWKPFALCQVCLDPEKAMHEHTRQMLSAYWTVKPEEQEVIRAVAFQKGERNKTMPTIYQFLYVVQGDESGLLAGTKGTLLIEAESEERAWAEAESAVKEDYPASEGWKGFDLALVGEITKGEHDGI